MSDIQEILERTAGEVLETMFFSAIVGPGADEPAVAPLTASVTFSGSRQGSLAVSADVSMATAHAANFLGADESEVPREQVEDIFGELANVICGAALGQLDPGGSFAITHPAVSTEPDVAASLQAMQAWQSLELMEGTLRLGWSLES